MCGKVYPACVRSAMPHVSETWGRNTSDLKRFLHNDRAMIHCICSTKDQDETPQASLRIKLGVRTFRQSLTVGGWYCMDMYRVPRPVPNLSKTYHSPAPEEQVGLERYGLHLSILISVYVFWMPLTHKTQTLEELVFGLAWCCQLMIMMKKKKNKTTEDKRS